MGGLIPSFAPLVGAIISAVEPPTALPAGATNASSFTARWTAVPDAVCYRLDVAAGEAFSPGTGGDVVISEMCDPESNYRTNRYIEIYNAGLRPVGIEGWSVEAMSARSGATNYFAWRLTGVINSAQALVCGDSGAVGFAPGFGAAWAASNYYWTGSDPNDGARLLNASSTVVDIAFLKGENKATRRLPAGGTGRTSWQEAEWYAESVDEAADSTPGSHSCDYPARGPDDILAAYDDLDAGDVTECTVTGLSSSSVYYYHVRACTAAETGPNSNIQAVETPAKPEPSNHVLGLSAGALSHRTLVLSWAEAPGVNPPDGYLIRGSTNGHGAIPDPADGANVPNNTKWAGGLYANKLARGATSCELRGLDGSRTYCFKLYPFANAFSAIDFKTNGIVPACDAVTHDDPLEDMEDSSVPAYTNGTVALGSGNWHFADALLGVSAYDRKGDQRAARIRGNGCIAMQFDVAGVEMLSAECANYSADSGGRLQIWKSTDGGSTWLAVGAAVDCGAVLCPFEVMAHERGPVRFKIQQTAGNRVNLDNVRFTAFIPRGAVFMLR